MRISIIGWVVFFVLIKSSSVTRADAADEWLLAEMAKRRIPGLSVAVIRGGEVIKQSAYGLSSIELGVPATVDTVYPLASMTKVFTAAAIMLLVEEGLISLDEPITMALPQLTERWSKVTIRHCLSHTSGLPETLTDGLNLTSVVSGDRNVLLEELAKMPADPAAEKSIYNQTGYILLAMVIEKVSGLDYQQFVHSRLFKPAGLAGMRFGDAWSIVPGRTNFYTALDFTADHSKLVVRDGNPVFSSKGISRYDAKFMPEIMMPAGGLNGSVRELVKWEAALSNGKILKASSLEEMTRPYRLSNGKDGAFGLGFFTLPLGPYSSVSYGGGAATWRLAIPAKQLTVIVLTNLQGSEPETLASGVASLYEPSIPLR